MERATSTTVQKTGEDCRKVCCVFVAVWAVAAVRNPALRSALDVGLASHDGALQTFPQPGICERHGFEQVDLLEQTGMSYDVLCIHHHWLIDVN